MNEKYYKIELIFKNFSKSFVVSALHELQAKERLINSLKLNYSDINQITINALL